jgi:voltage-gated potassium channel Kch
MTPEYISVGGIIVNLIALLLAVSRILAASTAAEVRSAERFARLETKTERVENDVQNLFRATSKRISDT